MYVSINLCAVYSGTVAHHNYELTQTANKKMNYNIIKMNKKGLYKNARPAF